MKNLIRCFAIIVAIVISNNNFAYDLKKDGICYNITSSNTVEVTKNPYRTYHGVVVIPSNITCDGVKYYSVTSIGDYAFNKCSSLTSITIPNSVTSIGNEAFRDCTSLTSITIPDSITSIGEQAFYSCTSLTTLNYNADSCGGNGFSYNYNNWFSGCNNITAVNIGENVRIIPNYFIKDKSLVTSITIPNSVTSIGDNAFAGCTSLTSVTIPNSVTSIGGYAFRDCSSLNSITIPNSVTSIGNSAFFCCTSLTSITIPNSVISIGYCTCYGCTSLTSITIPNSVTSIGEYAFGSCTSLSSITIPNSITSIGNKAFSNCSSLDTVICLGNIPADVKESSFNNNQSNMILIVPCGKSVVYQASPVWKWFGNIVENCEQSSIDDFIENTTVSLYPNPTNENTTLNIKGLNKQVDIIVTNQQGQIISTTTLAKGKEDLEIETSNLPSGLYYIRIQTDKFVKTQKLIKN